MCSMFQIFITILLLELTAGADREICGSQKIPPGHVTVTPNTTLYFNVPLDGTVTKRFEIMNTSGCRIAFLNRALRQKRIAVDPPVGVLDPKQSIKITVFGYEEHTLSKEDMDLVFVIFTNAPIESTMDFRRYWFLRDGLVRRKAVIIKYNV